MLKEITINKGAEVLIKGSQQEMMIILEIENHHTTSIKLTEIIVEEKIMREIIGDSTIRSMKMRNIEQCKKI